MKDLIKIKGKALLSFCEIKTDEARELEKRVKEASEKGNHAGYMKLKEELYKKFGTRKVVLENIVTTAGRTVLARLLIGDVTFSGEINYCALGTDATASTVGDTTLGVEVFRKQISSGSYSTSNAYISTFFTATETTGTYNEIGHFIDGAAGVNTGQLFSRIADPETVELPITKSATESLTIDYSIQL
ncbi:MAG: hypothetical protein P1P85_04145 [Patescibacteria group bacterium]|nr:hypothetical protein [Patescibacteria group bacterium]